MIKKIALSLIISSSFAFTACTTTTTPDTKPSTAANAVAPLTDKTWILTHIGGEAVTTKPTDHNIPALLLNSADQRVSGADGCNRIMGSYTATDTALSFGQMASTMMACLDENVNKVSQSYSQALAKVTGYQVTPTTLILKDSEGNSILQFTTAVQPR